MPCDSVNPPPNVTDTRTYYDHFRQFGEVVLISIIPKNGSVLQDVATKVVKEKQLRALVQSTDGATSAAPVWVKDLISRVRGRGPFRLLFPSQEGLKDEIELLTESIKVETENSEFPPWRVFISFNTEDGCEKCFAGSASKEFEGTYLVIKEAPEPSEFIYDHSGVENLRAFSHNLFSYFVALCIASLSYLVVYLLHQVQGTGAAMLVTLVIVGINAALPFLMKKLTLMVEIHHNREVVQQSILVKLLMSRCIVSAVLIYHVTPYQDKFSLLTLEAIQDIMLADAIVPIFRAIDVYGYFSRYMLAPVLGLNQESFNLFWRGTEYNLAERYANALKTVFIALFFAVPLPSGLFLGAITLAGNYVSDKYLLMHKWKRMPPIGAGLGRLCRIMFMFILFIHCLVSLHFFANWPYRGVCAGDEASIPNCHLTCDLNTSAMTSTQASLVYVYNVFSVVGFVIMILWMLKLVGRKILMRFFLFSPEDLKWVPSMHSKEASVVTLRSIGNARAYAPTITRDQLHERLICCDLSRIPPPFNYTVKSYDIDEICFEPLSSYKLDLSTEVLAKVFETCGGKVEFFAPPAPAAGHDLETQGSKDDGALNTENVVKQEMEMTGSGTGTNHF
jgi:hypothetical protein